MSKKFRAKFQLQEITTHQGDQRTLLFRAAWDPSIPENERFNKATPWGEIKMMVTNSDIAPEIGDYFYVDFNAAE